MPFNPVEVIGGIAVGEGVGGAVQAVVEPQLQSLKNTQWKAHPNVPVEVLSLADGVARGHLDYDTAAAVALFTGFGDAAFRALVTIARSGPGTGLAFELWRRGKLGEAAFRRALKRTGMEDEWIDALVEIKQHVLDPAVIAVAVQRGLLPNDGILPVGPPTGAGKVPPMPMVDLNPFTEAEGSGVDADRLKVLTRIVGLPASPDLAARMYFRGIIELADYYRAIAEGNTRNEWRESLLEGFRQIPTAHDGIEGRLRGWIDDAAMYAETARHGMSKADTDLLFKITGRPLSFHQVFIGLRRGGVYDGPIDTIDPAFLKALRESNIRSEWYNLAWAQRHSYPAPFVLRALTEAGDLTQEEAHQILLYIGWPTDLAASVSARWAALSAGGEPPLVSTYRNRAVTQVNAAYLRSEIGDPEATTLLEGLGLDGETIAFLLPLWAEQRSIPGAGLSRAQIKKAFAEGTFSRDVALARLVELGMPIGDAGVYLDE